MKKFGNGGYLYDSSEYVKLPSDLDWLAQGMVPRKGKSLIVAIAKTAKTTFAIQIARAMALGEPVLSYPTDKCLVLYVVLERHTDFRKKLKTISKGNVPPNLHIFEYKKLLILDSVKDTTGYDILCQVLTEAKPDVLILDSKYRTTIFKEANEEAANRWITRIDQLINQFACSFVVLHHSPKQEYEELVNRTAGSSYLSRWADVIIGIRRIGNNRRDPRRKLEFVSNAGDEPDDMNVEITDNGLEDKTNTISSKLADAVQILDEDITKRPKMRISDRIKELSASSKIGERTFWEAWNMLKP